MKIIARFSARCRSCRTAIRPGQIIDWERGVGSTHAECQPVRVTIPLLPADTARAAFQLIEGVATMVHRHRRAQ
jgi:hypothetical protein